jgi:hypothetical protein
MSMLTVTLVAGSLIILLGLLVWFVRRRLDRRHHHLQVQQAAWRIEARYRAAALMALQHTFGQQSRTKPLMPLSNLRTGRRYL